jgi:hypothetical protein
MPEKIGRFTGNVMKRGYLILFCFLLVLCSLRGSAQAPHVANDTIRLGGIVIGKDTLPVVFLDEVEVHDKLPRHFAKRREQMTRLRYNIAKVYPYALTAADVLKDVDVNLERFGDNKSARKAYLKSIERELNKRWKGELQDLTITQGQLLVKLIDRQTGKNCFSIIREMKGGFTATLWQGVAMLFANNLKREYDPTGDDRDIEAIVLDLETSNYYKYRAQLQKR